MTVRVMVFASVKEDQRGPFEAAYTEVASTVAGTPGHVRDELLRDDARPGGYILLSEWESEEQFRAWEDAPVHRRATTPMRPYWAGRIERKIYPVRATADGVRPGEGA
ncbi:MULTISPECIES: antibiotic biosynthesis monooxygenase [Actinomadura]|uniref:Antibiotic biosynthesis monooxygenase n=1 Tax=Actinomadura litoris TaxID=2678616 RepID=A0A7K1L2B5_9ACTN|nr:MULTISPECIES: antibiotic biosynthesis monooxygenase family protein [Actinomadura]MBT2208992.1 antibiotic biosynthesis monooxygenase [Actinomadura sp. NEAU-AAG7]MUN38443.1 antibiotic biosynthesis monooxygenase [Actinomadura litoris]